MKRSVIVQVGASGLAVVSGLVYLAATWGAGAPDPGDALEQYAREQMAQRRARASIEVRIGTPVAGPGLSADLLAERVGNQSDAIEGCYDDRDPGGGRIDLHLVIAPDGQVAATANGLSPNGDACVAAVFDGMYFPAPDDGHTVTALVPLIFVPS